MDIKNIRLVAKMLWPNRKLRAHDNDFNCPFCGGSGKLNINYDKGVYRCNKCGKAGDYMSLYTFMKKVDEKTAQTQINEAWEKMPAEEKQAFNNIEEEEVASPIRCRDFVYSLCVRRGNLKPEHLADLRKRGLTDEAIKKYRIVSFDEEILNNTFLEYLNILSRTKAPKVVRVPGFYRDETGKIACGPNEGYMIPVVNRDGKISFFQVRHFEGDVKEKKYTGFSSRFKPSGVGTSSCENVHYVGFDFSSKTTPKVVNLTEGCLKADIASFFSQKPFIAILGVNNTHQLADELKYLKEHGTQTINICLDMDYREKREVKRALFKIKEIIKDSGLNIRMVEWPSEYKGIDDYLLFLSQNKKA